MRPATSKQMCPSSQPTVDAAQVLGIVFHEADGPRVAYLDGPVPAKDIAEGVAGLSATRVLRIAAVCMENSCTRFDGKKCALASQIVAEVTPGQTAVPMCYIRSSCRWFLQEGKAACLRCTIIVTDRDEFHNRSLAEHID